MPKKAKVTEAQVTEKVEDTVEQPAGDSTETTGESNTTSVDTPTLTLADVKNAVNVIDYLVTNGGIKGWEAIQQISSVRARLSNFIDAVSPKSEETGENENTGTSENDTE